MSESDQEKEDKRVNSEMEDPNVTIDYLRARLLSERNVSKSARQRADELAERVAELEEQLRIVSFQRMRAEKATADVLAILGDYGFSDVSETVDSNSDQDIPSESRRSDKPGDEEEKPVNSRGKHESENSGSEFEFTPPPGRSLSWKGRKDNSRSTERYKDPFHRRRNSIASVSPSPRHRPGKSCRQVRRKESRHIQEVPETNATRADSSARGTSAAVKVSSIDDGGEAAEVFKDRGQILEAPVSGGTENEANASSSDLDNNVQGRDVDMEQAIENRAQLIGQFEAMERAQQEWEEKFRENNNSTPDSCDPGNRSDVTEERYEMKDQAPVTPRTTDTHIDSPDAEAIISSNFHQNGVSHSPFDLGQSKEWKDSDTPATEPLKEEFSFPLEKEKENLETSRTNNNSRSDNGNYDLHSSSPQDLSTSQLAPSVPPTTGASLSKEEAPASEMNALVPRKGSGELDGVLQALKHAKQSLQQKMKDLPLVQGGSVVPSPPSSTLRGTANYPVGVTGLFRLPTDFAVEENIGARNPGSASRLTLGSHYPDTTVTSSFNDQLVSGSYLATRSTSTYSEHFLSRQYQGQPVTSPYLEPSIYRQPPAPGYHISSEDRYPVGKYEESNPRFNSLTPYFDPPSGRGFPSSGGYVQQNGERGLPSSRGYVQQNGERGLPSSGGYVQQNGELPAGRYAEFGSRSASYRLPSDPYIDTGLLTSTRYTYPSHTLNYPYQDPTSLPPSRQALSRSLTGRTGGVPPADYLPFSNGTNPNLYRY